MEKIQQKLENLVVKKKLNQNLIKKIVAVKKQSKDKDNSCGGKCGHSNCTSVSMTSFSLVSFVEIEFNTNNFDFSTEKQKFYNSKTFISSGFSSIWLIPKIS